MMSTQIKSGIWDNHKRGAIGDFLKDRIKPRADLSFVSANFTARGLGLGANGNNIELNLEVNDNRDRDDLRNWFDEVWNDNSLVNDVKAEVLAYLSQLYQNHAPEFIYFKTLFHIFERYLSEAERGGLLNEKTGFYETQVWNMLYDFQRDGVKGAINKILKHNGCVLADSVGLGKTFEALAVIKYFELLNARVLVLCPKKLRDNWTVYRENDERNPLKEDRFAYTVLSHTDLSRESGKSGDVDLSTHSWGNYDLLVIDESHGHRKHADRRRNRARSRIAGQGLRKSAGQLIPRPALPPGSRPARSTPRARLSITWWTNH